MKEAAERAKREAAERERRSAPEKVVDDELGGLEEEARKAALTAAPPRRDLPAPASWRARMPAAGDLQQQIFRVTGANNGVWASFTGTDDDRTSRLSTHRPPFALTSEHGFGGECRRLRAKMSTASPVADLRLSTIMPRWCRPHRALSPRTDFWAPSDCRSLHRRPRRCRIPATVPPHAVASRPRPKAPRLHFA